MRRRLRVAVTGLHLGENCQPGPGVARSLRDALGDEVELVGLAYDVFDSSLHAPGFLDDAFLVPYPSVRPEVWLDRLEEIHGTCPIDVLIPCLDVELPLFKKLEPRLRDLGIATFLPDPGALERRAKDRLPELAAQAGIATPETIRLTDVAGLAAAGERLGYPLVVKGPFYEAEVTQGPVEAAAAFRKLSARWGLPLVAQRFVPGEEFDVACLGDGTGEVLGAVAMRKTIVTRLGKAWGAVTVEDDELLACARRVVSELRWRGGCEVELLRAASDGTPYLIEVNPRFPAWIYLGTAAGANLPLGLLHLALGDRPAPLVYRPGVFHVRHAAEAIGDLSVIERLLVEGRLGRPANQEVLP